MEENRSSPPRPLDLGELTCLRRSFEVYRVAAMVKENGLDQGVCNSPLTSTTISK